MTEIQIVKKHYKIYGSRMNPNHTFELYVIGNNPELIKNSSSLSENDMMELFNKGLIKYEHVMTCFDRFSYSNQSIIANEVTQFFIKTIAQRVGHFIRRNQVKTTFN